MNKINTTLYAALALTSLAITSGCGVSQATKDTVARAETVVTQAQQALGNSEAGALQMQSARTRLAQAKQAVAEGDEEPALQLAREATLDAELATAKSQSAAARKAADEMQASLETLRREAQRSLDRTR